MIATGTDIRPLECVFFMRAVRSRTYFEQMKGRSVRVINDADFQAVTPDAKTKTRFVIVDAVGVTDSALVDSQPPLTANRRFPSTRTPSPPATPHPARRVARLEADTTELAKAPISARPGSGSEAFMQALRALRARKAPARLLPAARVPGFLPGILQPPPS